MDGPYDLRKQKNNPIELTYNGEHVRWVAPSIADVVVVERNFGHASGLAAGAKLRDRLAEVLRALVERIGYYAELGENSSLNIEDWAYTDGSDDIAEAKLALAAYDAAKRESDGEQTDKPADWPKGTT